MCGKALECAGTSSSAQLLSKPFVKDLWINS
jgi:hypothetical protein